MANYTVDKIKYGSDVYILKDSNALPKSGGTVTGPVVFGDSVSMTEVTAGNIVVTGNASVTNNIQANTINGVTVGSSPKFTDTITTATTSGSGNAVTAITASNGALTVTKGTTFLTSADISGKIDTAGTGLSKSGTTLNHSNSVTAQTTQAVYPVKIDAQGHISAYGTAVTSMPASDVYSWAKASSKPTYTASEVGALASNTTYVSTITTTAGAHTAISSQSGAVSFNVPTKTSHLSNDSGFITSFTDTKLQVAAVTSGTTYYPIVGTGTTAATRQYDTTGFVYVGTNGTTSAVGSAKLTLGNSTASGTANNKQGQLIIYGSTAYAHTISGAPTAARTLTLPDATGTIALTSNIPDVSGKIDTAGTGLSKSGTTLNHSNSVTAQTTQNVYPIKIDAQGHISAYGTAITSAAAASGGTTVSLVTTGEKYTWNSKTSNTGTVTKVTAGAGLSGGDITTTGTIAHSNSVTAATTQKIYPIAIDAQGHISGYTSNTPISLDSDGDIIISDALVRFNEEGELTGFIQSNDGDLIIDNGFGNVQIHSLATPTENTDAANKAYVDSMAEGGSRSSFYGTCSTSASTAAKAVTATGFTFNAGNILCVNFTTANTAATPTLNVNSEGAKTIYITSTTALNATTNVLKWSANTLVYFMYDGTNFRYMTSVSAGGVASSRGAGHWYGTASTAAGTTAKTSTIANYVLTIGSTATITFSTANTVAAPTLNINSTGAKSIYNGNAITSATNPFYWGAGTTITFVYSGSYYYVLSYHTKVNHVDDTEYVDLAKALAIDYSANKTYFVGEFAIYDSSVYECNTAITTAESWTSSHWTLLGTV